MASQSHHLNHAIHNRAFLSSFFTSFEYNDWSITLCFYTCVHLIEFSIGSLPEINFSGKKLKLSNSSDLPSEATKAGIKHPFGLNETASHKLRNYVVQKSDEFRPISTEYTAMYHQSRSSRYESYQKGNDEVKKTIDKRLNKIILWVNTNFKKTIGLIELPQIQNSI